MNSRLHLHRIMHNGGPAATTELTREEFRKTCISLQGIVTFGRGSNNDVVFRVDPRQPDKEPEYISRSHAKLCLTVDEKGVEVYHVEDQSENGTYINDCRLKKSKKEQLRVGDTIKFGHRNGASFKEGEVAAQPDAEFTFRVEMPREECLVASGSHRSQLKVFASTPVAEKVDLCERMAYVGNSSGRSTESGFKTREADSTNELIGSIPQIFAQTFHDAASDQPTTSQSYISGLLNSRSFSTNTTTDFAALVHEILKKNQASPNPDSAQKLHATYPNIPVEIFKILLEMDVKDGTTDDERRLMISGTLRSKRCQTILSEKLNAKINEINAKVNVVRSDADSSEDHYTPVIQLNEDLPSSSVSSGTPSAQQPHVLFPAPRRCDLDRSFYHQYLANLKISQNIVDHMMNIFTWKSTYPELPLEYIMIALLPSLGQLREMRRNAESRATTEPKNDVQVEVSPSYQHVGVIVKPGEDVGEERHTASSSSTLSQTEADDILIDVECCESEIGASHPISLPVTALAVRTDEYNVREETQTPSDHTQKDDADKPLQQIPVDDSASDNASLHRGDSHTSSSATVSAITSPISSPEINKVPTSAVSPEETAEKQEAVIDCIEDITIPSETENKNHVQEELEETSVSDKEERDIKEVENKIDGDREDKDQAESSKETNAVMNVVEKIVEKHTKNKATGEEKQVKQKKRNSRREVEEKKVSDGPSKSSRNDAEKRVIAARKLTMKQLGDVSSVDSDSETDEKKITVRRSLRTAKAVSTPKNQPKRRREDVVEDEEDGNDSDSPSKQNKRAPLKRKIIQAKSRKPVVSEKPVLKDDDEEPPPKKRRGRKKTVKAIIEEDDDSMEVEKDSVAEENNQSSEDEETAVSSKDLCGAMPNKCEVHNRNFKNIEWVCCNACDQWFHVYCIRGKNCAYGKDESFTCCGGTEKVNNAQDSRTDGVKSSNRGRGRGKARK